MTEEKFVNKKGNIELEPTKIGIDQPERVYKRIYSIAPVLSQVYLRKLGMFCTSSLGNDIYHLKEVVDMLLNEIGEERVVDELKKDESENKKKNKELGDNWEKFKKKFDRMDVLLSDIKATYDLIENKKFSKITKENEREFIRKNKKIALFKQDIYTLFVFLIKATSLQRMTINSESFKVLERSYKVIGAVPSRRPMQPIQSPEVEISHE
jgi:hypothetical protein